MAGASHLSDEQVRAALAANNGSVAAAARQLQCVKSTLQKELQRRGLVPPPSARKRVPSTGQTLTREGMLRAMRPTNNCRVKVFLEHLDAESLAVFNEALSYDSRDFSAAALHRWLLEQGYPPEQVPPDESIKAHRRGAVPCRCAQEVKHGT